jgi:hypothetical protein
MKKLLVGLLLVNSVSAFAASPIQLVCYWDDHKSGEVDRCSINVEIPVTGTVAKIDKEKLSTLFIEICDTPPHKDEKVVFKANTGSTTMESFGYNDPNRKFYLNNMHLEKDNSMTYGYYDLDAGDFINLFGEMKLRLNVLKDISIDYEQQVRVDDVATVSVTTKNGTVYGSTCHLGYYHE